jgi:pimeloyl-ACP methyl ester carboxylesterase
VGGDINKKWEKRSASQYWVCLFLSIAMNDLCLPSSDIASLAGQLSEAAYVHGLPVWDSKEPDASYYNRLTRALQDTRGANSGNQMTEYQANLIADNFRLVRSRETEGFAGGLFEDRRTGTLILAIRGTATTTNIGRDDLLGIGGQGVARDATQEMTEFWNKDCADFHDRELIVAGHSLGGHVSSVFARLHPDNTERVETYNSAGVSDRLLFGPGKDWWQAQTNQVLDKTWGAAKTDAFSTDSGRSFVHGSFGGAYMQVGNQHPVPYAERPLNASALNEHSIVALNDAMRFQNTMTRLGMPDDMVDAYLRSVPVNGTQALYTATDEMAAALGANVRSSGTTRNDFYAHLAAMDELAPQMHGKLEYLGDFSPAELAIKAIQPTAQGADIRNALLAGSVFSAADGQHAEPTPAVNHNRQFWEQKAAEILERQQGTLSADKSVSPETARALELVRHGLGAAAQHYTDAQLATHLSPEVLHDIVQFGFPHQEVNSLHDYIRQQAEQNHYRCDAIDRMTALSTLVKASDGGALAVAISPETGRVTPVTTANSNQIQLSTQALQAVALGREPAMNSKQEPAGMSR